MKENSVIQKLCIFYTHNAQYVIKTKDRQSKRQNLKQIRTKQCKEIETNW